MFLTYTVQPRATLQNQWHNLLLISVAAVSASSAMADWNQTPETIENHPTWIYTPSTALPDGKHPLLIALHGCAQTHTEIKEFGNLKETADKNGMVVAVPGVGSRPFEPGCWDYNMASDDKQHIAELLRLTDKLKARASLNIDSDHVYIVGLSSGGAMALAVGCKAPSVFAGIGAIAGPSVGSSQNNALFDQSGIPSSNISAAINRCKSLAGNNQSHFDTQIANIAYGDMDKNGPKAVPLGTPGQKPVVSIKWSQDNVKVLQDIYGTGPLGPEVPVQEGLGTLKVAKKGNNDVRLSHLVVHNVGHAWPAGTGKPNSPSQGGDFIAQSGLDYPEFAVGWLISHNKRVQPVGRPEVTATATVAGTEISVTGTAKDSDGSIASLNTILLKADTAGTFQQSDSHSGISIGTSDSYLDKYDNLSKGWYKAGVTATDSTNNATTQLTAEVPVGNPPPLNPCQAFTDNNFNHVMNARAVQCSFGFACAKGSNENLGLFNLAVQSTVIETSPGFFKKGTCPAQ